MGRHNRTAAPLSRLTLSAVAGKPTGKPAAQLSPVSGRSRGAPGTVARYLEIRPAPRARVSAELVAERIRADRGNVWPAVDAYGISYRHALEIRAGWRGAGRRAEPIAYAARGWTNGRRNGAAARFRVIQGGR